VNLVYGEIIEVASENGTPVGEVRVRGATQKIPLGLLTDAVRGDRVLICDGVAISKVAAPNERKTEHVSGDSRETH
jgi:hydrogenase maturation factor